VGSLAWMVRATSGVKGAYGFETESEEGAAQLRVGLSIAAGVNRVTVEGTQVLVTTLSRRLAERQAAAHWAHYLRGPVSRTLADRMIAGRLPRLIPVVGGVVGAGMNVAMVRTVGGRARRHYRDLLLQWQRNQGVQPPALWYAG